MGVVVRERTPDYHAAKNGLPQAYIAKGATRNAQGQSTSSLKCWQLVADVEHCYLSVTPYTPRVYPGRSRQAHELLLVKLCVQFLSVLTYFIV